MYSRNQHDIIKQLYSNKKSIKKKGNSSSLAFSFLFASTLPTLLLTLMVILASSLVSLPPASSPTEEERDRLAAGREAFLVSSSNSLGTGYRYSSDSVPQVFCRDIYIPTLEEGMTTPSSVLVWRIPWTGEPGKLHPWGCKEPITTEQLAHTHTHAHVCVKCVGTCACVHSSVFMWEWRWGDG